MSSNAMIQQEQKLQQWLPWLKAGLGLLVLTLVGGIGFLVFKELGNRKNEKSFEALREVDVLELEAEKEADKSKGNAFDLILAWPADKKQAYEDKLREVISKWPGTTGGYSAELRLGRIYFAEKRYADAEGVFRGLAASLGTSEKALLFKAMAQENLATTLESAGRVREANHEYLVGTEIKNNPLKPLQMLGLGRTHKSLGNKNEAHAVYEKIIQEYPNTQYERKARVLINLT
jgi:TolA-binding protein